MASKRDVKKAVKDMVFDVMDECDYVIVSGGKGAAKAEKLMDEVVDFYETIIQKINQSKDKAAFKSVSNEIAEKAEHFIHEMYELNK